MKRGIIIIGCSILSLTGCKKGLTQSGSKGCIDQSLINPNAICTMDYRPVCGCDGKTYSNACVAKNTAGVTSYKEGACK